jgi:signal transduction histidine kinase
MQKTPPPPDVREAMQAGLASGEGFEVELVNHTRDGRPYRVEILCSPLHDQHGIHSGFIAIQIDVTERYGLEERLRQSQKLEAVGQLTTGLAHDFNNLLSVILGCAELLESKVEDKPDLRKLIAMTIGAAERGSDLTRSLLAFSRRQPLDPQTADLAALTKEFAPLLRRTLGENIRLTILADEAPWTVRVDVSQYESAVLNLAVNARDAMAEGGTLSIRISNKDIDRTEIADLKDVRPGPYVCVDVADNGHGMPPEVLERVFEPFFSTKPKHNNSGLGLSMVFGFLAQSGGFVRIESKVDKGTKISLFFPRATAKEDEGPNAGDA